jgi:hypothetical protein
MYYQPTIEILESSPSIYILIDGRGNIVGAGSPEVINVLVGMSKRCERPEPKPASVYRPVEHGSRSLTTHH